MEITVNIKCPDLSLAAAALAKAIIGNAVKNDIDPAAGKDHLQHPVVETDPAPAAPVLPQVSHTPAPNPATTTPAAAMTAPTAPTAVPTTPAPEITGDMVAKAGADLIAANPAAMAQLNALLQKYQVGCAQELRPDQIGPFATEMRAMGAKI